MIYGEALFAFAFHCLARPAADSGEAIFRGSVPKWKMERGMCNQQRLQDVRSVIGGVARGLLMIVA